MFAQRFKELRLAGTDLAFDGEPKEDNTLVKVMAALDSGMRMAKIEAKEKYMTKRD